VTVKSLDDTIIIRIIHIEVTSEWGSGGKTKEFFLSKLQTSFLGYFSRQTSSLLLIGFLIHHTDGVRFHLSALLET